MAHGLLWTTVTMSSPQKDDDLICSCGHPACTITSVWRSATGDGAEEDAVPQPLPFDLSDMTVTPIARYRVPTPPAGLLPPARLSAQRVA